MNNDYDLIGNLMIHYVNDNVKEMYNQFGGVKTEKSAGFDCINIEEVKMNKGDFQYIDLGIIAKSETKSLRINLYPRSSTFKKWGLIQTNSVGIIDYDYCGPEDIIKMPAYATRDIVIPKGTPIAQLVLVQNIIINTYEFNPSQNKSRGGFGSTDKE